MNELTQIDLFSGIGGFSLAGRWAGFRTVAFCERDEWCQRVLVKNFGARVISNAQSAGQLREKQLENHSGCERNREGTTNAAAQSEIRSKNFGAVVADTKHMRQQYGKHTARPRPEEGLSASNGIDIIPNVFDFNGTAYRGATLLTGGFPCQPFSCAGKRRGAADDRALWPEMARIIAEAQPRWVLGENVAGLVTMELDRVLSDLEALGYTVWTAIVPACGVDARHKRDRVWIVAHSNERECTTRIRDSMGTRTSRDIQTPCSSDESPIAHSNSERGRLRDGSDTNSEGLEGRQKIGDAGIGGTQCYKQFERCCQFADWNNRQSESRMGDLVDGLSARLAGGFASWPEEDPQIPRVATGVKDRVNKLKGLGNAIVPQVAFEIMRVIAEIERSYEKPTLE